MSDKGIKLMAESHRWTAAVFLNNGWNPRFLEGCDHFFFYNLKYLTRKSFIHGEPVCLGIILVSALADNDMEGMLKSIKEIGVRITPEEMGVSKEDVIKAFVTAGEYAEREGLWYTVLNYKKVDRFFVNNVLKKIY